METNSKLFVSKKQPVSELLFIFLLGVLYCLTIQYIYSHKFGTDWSRLLHLDDSVSITKLIKDDFKPYRISTGPGHDGIWSYIIARDPFLANNLAHSALRVGWGTNDFGFRYRRIFYSLLAGGFGTFSPVSTLWGLILVSAFGFGLAAAATRSLFHGYSLPLIYSLVIFINSGLIASACILTSDCLAFGLAMTGLVLYCRDYLKIALVCFSLTALTKDTYILIPFSIAIHNLFLGKVKVAALFSIVPAIPIGLWVVWLTAFAKLPQASGAVGDLTFPFFGIYKLLTSEYDPIFKDYFNPTLALLLLVASVWTALYSKVALIRWLALPWILLAIILSDWIWRPTKDSIRALAFLYVPVALNIGLVFENFRKARSLKPLDPD